MPNARFCAFCGVKLSGEAVSPAPTETVHTTEAVSSDSIRGNTARPLNDNPYQPHRAPVITRPSVKPILGVPSEDDRAASAAESAEHAEIAAPEEPFTFEELPIERPAVEEPLTAEKNTAAPKADPADAPASNDSITRVRIKSSPKRVFMFSDEEEETVRAHGKNAAVDLYDDEDDDDEYVEEYDGIREFEENHEFEDDEDDYYEEYEDEDEPAAGRIFVQVFSILTVLLLIAGVVAFAYGTSVGRRLRASMGLSSSAEDYLLLADWQLAQHTLSDASDSYYNAFKLDMDNYELALKVGTGFENAGDDAHAEALYSYLITQNPQKDEPYDRLMTLLNRQGRSDEYKALLDYRSAQQPSYEPPVSQVSQILRTPTASHESGAYAGMLSLTLDAGGAEIRYTIDGTAPGAQSLLYTGPINLSRGSHIIRAVAVVNGIISAEWTGNFFIS